MCPREHLYFTRCMPMRCYRWNKFSTKHQSNWLKEHNHICVGTFNTNHVTTLGQDERRICVGMFWNFRISKHITTLKIIINKQFWPLHNIEFKKLLRHSPKVHIIDQTIMHQYISRKFNYEFLDMLNKKKSCWWHNP